MKKREITGARPVTTKRKGSVLTVQQTEHLLVINYWKNGILRGRYAIDKTTHEYGYFDDEGIWSCGRLCSLLGANSYEGYWYVKKDVIFDTKKQEEEVEDLQKTQIYGKKDVFDILEILETTYGREKRKKRKKEDTERYRL